MQIEARGQLYNAQSHCTYSTGPINKIFVRILFAFNSCCVIFIEWNFYYFVMCKCMSTTVRVNGTVQLLQSYVRVNGTVQLLQS